MSRHVTGLLAIAACAVIASGSPSSQAAFRDPLDTPAAKSPRAAQSMLIAVTKTSAGVWIAVGRRGHILLSPDAKTWRQARSVPVSTDLVSVYFFDATHGWAVGHGGVILATT